MSSSGGAVAKWFDLDLALRWDSLISKVDTTFVEGSISRHVATSLDGLPYSRRLEVFADAFDSTITGSYKRKCQLLTACLGPENPAQTGTFSNFYWVLPFSRFVERHGLDDVETSLEAIAAITKRSTGEYAIRPFAERYPERILRQAALWAGSDNFHLRRLASEGIRPRLPWAKKLTVYLDNPSEIFSILNLLRNDDTKYVRKSVANHASDYLRTHPEMIMELIDSWRGEESKNVSDVITMFDRRAKKAADAAR